MAEVELICGDCLDVMPTLEAGSVDAFVVDLPYAKKYLPLYWAIAEQAQRLLKVGGSLLMIVPHYAMPVVLERVGKFLKYRWMHCMWQATGNHPRMAMGIEVMWKPIGWWVKEKWPQGRGFVRDGFENEQPNKFNHEWEQGMTWADFCLNMVPVGGVVVDPAMGIGTSGISAIQSGFGFIGIEIDPGYFEIAQRRIKEAQTEVVQARMAI